MDNFGAIILAAGKSTRFGDVKQLAILNNKPLYFYSVDLARRTNLNPVFLIGNERTEQIREEVVGPNINYIENNNYHEGMASSIRLGISALTKEVRGLFIMLADQPFIKDEVIIKMIETYKSQYSNGIRIVRPSYDGVLGHPVLFDHSFFEDLMDLKGDTGARSVLQANLEKVAIVNFQNKQWNMDIDSLEDLEKAKQLLNQQQI